MYSAPVMDSAVRQTHDLDDGVGDVCQSVDHHVVQFYEDDAFLCDVAVRFFSAGFEEGESAVMVATAP